MAIEATLSRLRERDSKWLAQNQLVDQANRISDFVLRYEGCGEKCVLQPQSRATEAARQILRDEKPSKIPGIFAAFSDRSTASQLMVAEGLGFEPTVRTARFRPFQ